jgi:hypothetical protein
MPDREFSRSGIVAQLASSSRQFRIDAASHVANVSWLAALANPPPTPPLQGGESLAAKSQFTATANGRNHRPAARPRPTRRASS